MLPFRPNPETGNSDPPTAMGDGSQGKQATGNLPIEHDDEFAQDEIPESLNLVAAEDQAVPLLHLGHLGGTLPPHPAPSVISSHTMPSSGGDTFSTLTGVSLVRAGMTRGQAGTEPLLSHMCPHLMLDENIRHQPLEVKGDERASGPEQDRPPPCFPWAFQFSWSRDTHTRAVVLFGGEPLDVNPDVDCHVSEAASTIASDTEFFEPTVVLPNASEPSCDSEAETEFLEATAFEWGERRRAIMERREFFFQLLYDHFLRTFPPLRPARQTRRAAGPLSSTSTSTTSSRPGSGNASRSDRASSSRGRKITGGSGGGEEGDDDDEDGPLPPTPSQPQRTRNGPLFACPYLKWDAVEYARCGAGHRRMCDVKTHLAKAHYALTCPDCNRIYDGKSPVRLHRKRGCGPGTYQPPDCRVLTDEKLVRIREHGSGSPEDQWKRVFGIIFPGHPYPQSIYLEGMRLEIYNQYGHWLDKTGRNALRVGQREEYAFDDFSFAEESQARQHDGVIDQFSDFYYPNAAVAVGLIGASQSTGPGLHVPLISGRPLNQYNSSGNSDTPHPPADNPTTDIYSVTQPISDPITLEAPYGNISSDTVGLDLTTALPSTNASWSQWLSSEEGPWSTVSRGHAQEAGPSNSWRPDNCVQGEVAGWGMFPE